MKPSVLIYIMYFSCCCLGLRGQTRATDSIYKDYQGSPTIGQKIRKAPGTVQALCDRNAYDKARLVISDLKGLKTNDSTRSFQQGIVLLSGGLLYKSLDSTDQSLTLSKRATAYLGGHKGELAEAYSLILVNHFMKGQFDTVIRTGNRLLPEIRESRNINAELEATMSLARSYDFLGDRKKAIELSLQSIDLAKQHHKDIKLSELYINMSTIYKSEDVQAAKLYALKSLDVLGRSQDFLVQNVISAAYLMLGNVYFDLSKRDSALYYYELSKESALRAGDHRTYLSAIGNIGNIFYREGRYPEAIEYNLLTLQGYKKLNLTSEVAVAYGSLADIYKDMRSFGLAVQYYDSALTLTQQIQSADDYIYNYKGLSETYEMMGDYKQAFRYYKLYKLWNDSINNNQNSKRITQLELDYKYRAEQKEKDLIAQEKIDRQRYIIWAVIAGTIVLLGFLALSIRTGLSRKRSNAKLQSFNDEILRQKDIIEEKNNEITDSITYASRIQQGVIPGDEEMLSLFPQHFVFFRPRDIVSGDFYWANRAGRTNHVLLAVADCTGHGVPGAFMSLVGNTLLNQTLNNPAISSPAAALDYINQQLPKTIRSKSSTGTIKDGMEIAMCEFDFDRLNLRFAGANSNIYLVRSGQILIFKGDKQPIGESLSGQSLPYTDHNIPLQKDDVVYLITDGYADQFGGERGKKFKYKPLEDLFCAISGKSMKEQRTIVSDTFNNWKLNHEQVDDVLVIGVKL